MAKNTYTDLTVEELKESISSESSNLQQLKFNHSVSPLENPMKIRESRRAIARMQTELQKRQKNND